MDNEEVHDAVLPGHCSHKVARKERWGELRPSWVPRILAARAKMNEPRRKRDEKTFQYRIGRPKPDDRGPALPPSDYSSSIFRADD